MELLGRKREPFFVSSLKMIEPKLACSILNVNGENSLGMIFTFIVYFLTYKDSYL